MVLTAATSGANWSLFKEQVDDTIIKALQPKIVYPLMAKTYPASGPVVQWNYTNSWLQPEEVSESGEYVSNTMEFERRFATIRDVGLAPRIPINWIKDARWDLVQDHVEAMGFGIARHLNADFLAAIKIFVEGGTYNGQSVTAVTDGTQAASAQWSTSSADVTKDISLGVGLLEEDDAGQGRKYLIVHPKNFKYLRIDPNLMRYINYGNANLLQKGVYPTTFGVDILSTSQAATDDGLVVNSDLASIKYYEREPLTTDMSRAERIKALDIVGYIRYAFAVGRPRGVRAITGIGS